MLMQKRLKKLLNCDGLDEWTRSFIESLLTQYLAKGKLSSRQMEILEEKEKDFGRNQEWVAEWDDTKAQIFELCASYYKKTDYYRPTISSIAWEDNKINWDKTPIPPRASYNKMCMNKYAKRLIEYNNQPPLYEVGSAVQLRNISPYSSADGRLIRRIGRTALVNGQEVVTPLIVIANDGPHRRPGPTKGSRVYSVLKMGQASPIEVPEKILMKFKKK